MRPSLLPNLSVILARRPKGTKIMELERFAMAPPRKIAAITVVALLVSLEQASHAADVFTLANVAVDETAADAAAARKIALAVGQRQALARLVKRLVPLIDQSRFPPLMDEDITGLVRSFEIEREKVAPNRYIASVNFRFKPRAISALMRAHHISYAESAGDALLVLPVLTAGGNTELWGEFNPWLAAWAALPPSDGLREVIVPIGDLTDILAFDVVASSSVSQFPDPQAIASRYGAGETIVIGATLADATSHAVSAVEVSIGGPEKSRRTIYRGTVGGTVQTLLAAAAEATRNQLEEDWKSANLLRFDRVGTLDVDITYDGFSDWLDIRRRLDDLVLVRDVVIDQISPRFARVTLHYLGDRVRLEEALAKFSLRLDRGAGVWLLRPANQVDPEASDTRSPPAAVATPW